MKSKISMIYWIKYVELLNSIHSMISLWSKEYKTLGVGEWEWECGVHVCICITLWKKNKNKEKYKEKSRRGYKPNCQHWLPQKNEIRRCGDWPLILSPPHCWGCGPCGLACYRNASLKDRKKLDPLAPNCSPIWFSKEQSEQPTEFQLCEVWKPRVAEAI